MLNYHEISIPSGTILKPCPFCCVGRSVMWEVLPKYKDGVEMHTEYIIRCNNCFGSMSATSVESVIRDWQKRIDIYDFENEYLADMEMKPAE